MIFRVIWELIKNTAELEIYRCTYCNKVIGEWEIDTGWITCKGEPHRIHRTDQVTFIELIGLLISYLRYKDFVKRGKTK